MYKQIIERLEVKDLGKGLVEVVMSSEAVDRDGDIIRVDGWDLKDFTKHPVLIASHDYRNLRNQIGEWHDVGPRGKKLIGKAQYYVGEGNEQADWGYALAQKGRAAFSVGFMPDMDKVVRMESGGFEFNSQKLLECSQVVIPANQEALQRMKALGLHPTIADIVDEELEALGIPTQIVELEVAEMPYEDIIRIADEVVYQMSKGALPPHTTPKADEDTDWDAGAVMREVEGERQLRLVSTWVDGAGDPDAKASYKLPHHLADGKVVWRGVAAAMTALLGGRGGVAIPDGDRKGVYRHLANHYKQFDKEPPEFKELLSPEESIRAFEDIVEKFASGRSN